jgi:hypothetical protein
MRMMRVSHHAQDGVSEVQRCGKSLAMVEPVGMLLSCAAHPGEPACRICILLPHRRCAAVVSPAGAQCWAAAVATLRPVGEQAIQATTDR